MNTQVLQLIDIFNLIASIFGIVMAILALVLSLIFFFSAKKTERDTNIAMRDLRSSTVSLEKLSMRLLDRMAKALVAPNPTEERLIEVLGNIATPINLPSGGSGDQESEGRITKERLEQFRVDNLITAAFYAATANITLQKIIKDLPEPERNDPNITLINGLNQSAGDFGTLMAWIRNSDNWEHKVEISPIKQYWHGNESVENDVLNYDRLRTTIGGTL